MGVAPVIEHDFPSTIRVGYFHDLGNLKNEAHGTTMHVPGCFFGPKGVSSGDGSISGSSFQHVPTSWLHKMDVDDV